MTQTKRINSHQIDTARCMDFAKLRKQLLAERQAASPNKQDAAIVTRSDIPEAVRSAPRPGTLVKLQLQAEGAHTTGIGPIPTVSFVENCVDEAGAAVLWENVYAAPERFIVLPRTGRRLQQYGGEPRSGGLVNPEPLPAWLESLAEQLVAAGVFPPDRKPNHALINEYLPGQGILPHTDGGAYWPVVATISLGSPALMHYQQIGASTPLEAEVILPPRSLVVTRDAAYSAYMHSIPVCSEEVVGAACSVVVNDGAGGLKVGDTITRTTRVSITIRHVPTTTDAADAAPVFGSSGSGGSGGGM